MVGFFGRLAHHCREPRLIVAHPVFYMLDYSSTFSREVNLFWNRRFTGGSLLYFFIRYNYLLLVLCDTIWPTGNQVGRNVTYNLIVLN